MTVLYSFDNEFLFKSGTTFCFLFLVKPKLAVTNHTEN